MADGLLRAEGGQADVVMLSGGEPTLHPEFFRVADPSSPGRSDT